MLTRSLQDLGLPRSSPTRGINGIRDNAWKMGCSSRYGSRNQDVGDRPFRKIWRPESGGVSSRPGSRCKRTTVRNERRRQMVALCERTDLTGVTNSNGGENPVRRMLSS